MAELPFLKPAGEPRERVVKSRPNSNANGQMIKAGGMTLVHCKPECDEEFRTGSHPSVLIAQLEAAGWQVTEMADKTKRFRCPTHRVLERAMMSGRELEPRQKRDSMSERKLAGRSSHDGGNK
jgi:hypothetical protein